MFTLQVDVSPEFFEYPQVVRTLLQYGADPSLKDGSGKTAIMGAVLRGRAGALRKVEGCLLRVVS